MRLVYFGSGAFGIPTLGSLARTHTLLAIVTQPDRPAGRGGKLTPTPVAQWAGEYAPSIPLFKPERVNAADVVSSLRGLGADAWVVIAFGQKLGKGLLEGVTAINLHASLLPRWRGAAPINAALLAGDTTTGNSVITLADRMDAGLILGQSSRAIDAAQTAGELHDLLSADGPALVHAVLEQIRTGTLEPIVQDESRVTIAPKLGKGDGVLDFTLSAEYVRRRVHGLTPRPGVSVLAGSLGELKLLRVQETDAADRSGAPGEIVDPARGLVSCGSGTTLRLVEVQAPGKRAMSWGDYARGRAVPAGTVLRAREASAC